MTLLRIAGMKTVTESNVVCVLFAKIENNRHINGLFEILDHDLCTQKHADGFVSLQVYCSVNEMDDSDARLKLTVHQNGIIRLTNFSGDVISHLEIE